MKNKELKRIVWMSAFHGLIFGLLITLVVLLLAADSEAYHNSARTMADFTRSFPAFWVVIFLPPLCATAAFLLARPMASVIRDMKKRLKDEGKRSKHVLDFVESLSAGNLDATLVAEDNSKEQTITRKAKDDDQKDFLVESLRKLQNSLKENKKAEAERHREEENRTWVTKGVAELGEILRRNSADMAEMSYNVIRYIVDYMKINQAGFFLLKTKDDDTEIQSNNKEDQYFELTAHVAFGYKKYTNKTIHWGEGLVGRCGQEMQTIHMTDIPENYIEVTSGLGHSNPRAILLVPLKSNDVVYGVIEMASFSEAFKEHEIQFVEQIAESIAMTISTVSTNMRTQKLLQETQLQAEKMRKQEETMSQNAEEMRANLEQVRRAQSEIKGFIDAIDQASISCQFDTAGYIISVNQNFLKAFGYKEAEVKNQSMSIFFFDNEKDKLAEMLDKLSNGESVSGRTRRRGHNGEEIHLLSTYSPVVDTETKEVMRIISIETDIAEQVKLEREMDARLEEQKEQLQEQFMEVANVKERNEKTLDGMLDAIITTNHKGRIEFFNKAAESLWGYGREEVLGKKVNMLFSAETIEANEFVKAFVTPDMDKTVGSRVEVPIKNKFGEEVPVLFLISEAEVGNEHSFTAFIQNAEIDLF